MTSAFFGADFEQGRWLAGAAASVSEGEGGHRSVDGEDGGEVRSTLTTFYPYARAKMNDRVDIWGFAGLGGGRLTLTRDANDASYRTDLSMRMGALGMRGRSSLPTIPEVSRSTSEAMRSG